MESVNDSYSGSDVRTSMSVAYRGPLLVHSSKKLEIRQEVDQQLVPKAMLEHPPDVADGASRKSAHFRQF